MIRAIHKILIGVISKKIKKDHKDYDEDKILSEANVVEVGVTHLFGDIIFIILGIISAGFGLKGFLLPSSFIDGGVTGISLLTSEITGISLAILIVVINLPFVLLGYSQVGKEFAVKSIIAIFGLALVVHFVPYPVVTTDKLLIAFFGGSFLGAGIGLAIRGGAVLDGTEVLAIYFSKKTGLTIGDIILIFNIIIFSFGAYILSVEIALYAILTYMAASKTIDFVIEGIEEYTGITIISVYSEEIRLMITEKLQRGVTIYSGKGGYGNTGEKLKEIDIVFTVVTRLEIRRLRTEIDKIDSNAFLIMNSIKDTKGGMIKKRPLDH
ncbi:MAG: YitT family protein [Flavobacteriales bacterium]|nr:YitT family protein [Flavobacteriales bacterium]